MKKTFKLTLFGAAVILCAAALFNPFRPIFRADAPAPESTLPEPTAAPAVSVSTPAPTPDLTELSVTVTELMASNGTTLADEQFAFPDWFELYNPGGESCSLEGLWLSNDPEKPMKWQLPALTLAPGEYTVIFCSGNAQENGQLHAPFRLDKDGGTLVFSSPMGFPLLTVEYPAMKKDMAAQFSPDGVTLTREASPGFPNTPQGREDFIADNDRHGDLVISEAVPYNDDYGFHADGYFDWVELYNSSDHDLLLSDYCLTDTASEPFLFRLPERTLSPGAFFIVYLGTPTLETYSIHAPFSLSSQGDTLLLYRTDGTLSDAVGMYDMPLGTSCGRMIGEKGFFLFSRRTPNTYNYDGLRTACEAPYAVTPQGLYEGESVTVSLATDGDGEIHYTTNGKLPTVYSPVYTGELTFTETTVLRIRSFAEGKLPSDCESYIYFLNVAHELPVFSIVCSPNEFDVLYHGAPYNKVYATATLFDDGECFRADCYVTQHGTSAIEVWNKKNLKLVFRERYGGDVEYPIFEDSDITSFHSLLLRGGDSSGMHTYRDSLASLVANKVAVTDPYTLNSRYCILYVNGFYYGIHALREAYSAGYVAQHSGSKESASEVCRAPITEPQSEELFSLYSYIISHDLSDEENYQYAADRMDMQSMAQWLCFECYFNNLDPTGNIRYVRGTEPDSKWRLALFDFDISMTNNVASLVAVQDISAQIGNMVASLRRNDEFCTLVLETAQQLRANGLTSEYCLSVFDSMVEELEPEMRRNLLRWSEGLNDYPPAVDWQRSCFTEQRDRTWAEELRSFTRASEEDMKLYFPEFY